MVIDTSALIAILLGEASADDLVAAMVADDTRMVGGPTLVQASAVMVARKGPQGEIALDALLQRLHIEVVGMSPEAATFARAAYARYGKGVGSPGVLDFGDCLAYGVARAADEPLLFTGEDFSQTDIPRALGS